MSKPFASGSEELMSWFNGSKIVDENGIPLIVYRSQKDNREQGADRQSKHYGIYFSANEDSTKIYGNITKKYYLKVINPLVLKDTQWNLSVIPEHIYLDLIKNGYDGAVWNRKGEMYEIVVFDRNQIREIE